MKKYFYSGNTPIRGGKNAQTCGIVTVDDDDFDPNDVIDQISKDKAIEFGVDSFTLIAFNRID